MGNCPSFLTISHLYMNDAWDIIDAFEPMMTDCIGLSGNRKNGNKINTSMLACVFPVEDIEPFSDSDIDTSIKKIEVIINDCFEKDSTDYPQIGDKITLDDSSIWKISNVKKSLNAIKIEARSC